MGLSPLGRSGAALAVLALAALTFAAYTPALDGGFLWDDDAHVTHNPTLTDPSGLVRIWTEIGAVPQYYPLVHTTFWIEHHLWGANPLPYHLVNVMLHTLNGVLVWRILRRLRVPGCWLAGAVFALHPLHVESVAWITERKNVLSGALYLLSLLFFLRARPLDLDAPPLHRRTVVLSFLFYLGALLAKTVTCSLPAAILLLGWWKRGRIRRSDAFVLLPWFAVGLAASFLTVAMEKTHVGAAGPEWALSWPSRILVAGRAIWFYLAKLAWPVGLTFNYPRWDLDLRSPIQLAFPAAALALAIALWAARGRIGRGPLAAYLFFVGTLTPALGIFDVYPMRYSFVADHFAYLASLGPIAAATTAWFAAPMSGRIRTAATSALLALLAVLVFLQARVYQGPESLWTDTLAKNPQSWLAHTNLGVLRRSEGRIPEAVAHYEAALEHNPANAEAHNNLGNVLQTQGRTEAAIAHFREALRIDPEYAGAHNDLGIALADRGDLAGAVLSYREAIRLMPRLAAAHFNLGNALVRVGRIDDAIAEYREAVRLEPTLVSAHYNLGVALEDLGSAEEARRCFETALRLDPGFTPTPR